MKTLPFVKVLGFLCYFLLLSFLIRHLPLETVSPDACIRHRGGMSIFPEVSHSKNEHKISCEPRAHLLGDGMLS
jgi:hypothetical protein